MAVADTRSAPSVAPFHTIAVVSLVVVSGSAVGILTAPDAWYGSLAKPAFHPPSWVFAPVWTALYVLIGVAGARTWWRAPASLSMGLWAVQMALNLAWPTVFFGMHRPDLALATIVAMWAAIAGFVGTRWRPDPVSAVLFLPYLAWTTFATVLNGAIVTLNP